MQIRLVKGLAGFSVAAILVLAGCSGTNNSSFTPGAGPFGPSISHVSFAPAASKITSIVWTKVPALTAGKSVSKTKGKVTLSVKSGKTVLSGTYPSSIRLTVGADMGAVKLFINGKAASKTNLVTASNDKITLSYSGLAVSPIKLSAGTKGVSGHKKIVITATPVVYTGPSGSISTQEVDLTATSGTGSTGTFTAAQTGWTNSPYNKPLTYAFSAQGSLTNNCPGGSAAAYTISPASGAAGSTFTVTATSTAAAGACTMTITGALGSTTTVVLTYTTTGVVVGSHPAR